MADDIIETEAMPLKKYFIESRHISPYRQGFLEVAMDGEGIRLRWYGQTNWEGLTPWAQIVAACGMQNEMLRDDLRFIRQDAHEQGYKEGYEEGLRCALEMRK